MRKFILITLIIQAFCALIFIFQTLSAIIGLPGGPLPWNVHELVELGAVLGLVLGSVMGTFALRRSIRQRDDAHARLRVATQAFMDILEERFAEWDLTPAERDVALFAIKGLSIQEIAVLRETSEGTVKAQTNAIYRKADVTGRPQLISSFIEDLMDGKMWQSTPSPETPR